MKATVAVVVPFYNGHEYFDKLIGSIDKAAVGISCKVFIIDNSPEQIAVQMPVCNNLVLEMVRTQPAIGYGKACNRGFDLCRKEGIGFVIIANQDGYFSTDMITGLLSPFETDGSVMVVAPMLKVYGNEGIEDFFVEYYLRQVPDLVSDLFAGQPSHHYEMRSISGACFAFRMDETKYPFPYLFDPVFHMYFEDEDFCRRVRSLGSKIVLVPRGADFYHQHSHTTDLENKETITSDKMLGEKIFRVKAPDKSMAASFYGVFVSTSSWCVYHLLRGELRFMLRQMGTSFRVLTKLSRIRRTRRLEAHAAGG